MEDSAIMQEISNTQYFKVQKDQEKIAAEQKAKDPFADATADELPF